MATLESHTTRSDGVTLVELVVTSDVKERVRVENCLDGPVWPPRRQGVPEEGWTGEGYESEVGPDDRLVAGYATPAEPCEPPARLVSLDTASDNSGKTPQAVVRNLGDPRPPREGVALPEDALDSPVPTESPEKDVSEPGESGRAAPDSDENHRETADTAATDPDTTEPATSDPTPGDDAPQGESTPQRTEGDHLPVDGEGPPPEFDAYLTRVRERLGKAEGLAGPSTAGEASEALATVGGPEEAAAMQEQLAADRERLAQLGTECQRLAARIDAVDVPVETLARLT